jgi:hypothetical protein
MYLLNHAFGELRSQPHSASNPHRHLLLETLEKRCLLTTLILDETFKAPNFTATGDFEAATVIPPVGYANQYSGNSVVNGQVVYTSPNAGHAEVEFSGMGTGEDDCWAYSFQYHGFATLEDHQGALSQFDVSIDQFEYLAPSVPGCAGGAPIIVDDDINGLFSTSNFETELSWLTLGSSGQTSGSWTGELNFDGDLIDIQLTNASCDDSTLVFEFTVSGAPSNSVDHMTPIAEVEVFWADGPTAADTMGAPVTESVPIYWNQAGGKVAVTDLPAAPPTATHLLVIADYDNQVAELDESNNILSVGPCWRNNAHPLDVNGDGYVVPLDALLLINYLNLHEASELPTLGPGEVPPSFLDVNGDDWIAPIDVLCIINYLNSLYLRQAEVAAVDANIQQPLQAEPMITLGLELDTLDSELVPEETERHSEPQGSSTTVTMDAALMEYLTTDPQSVPRFVDLTASQPTDAVRCDLFSCDEEFWN